MSTITPLPTPPSRDDPTNFSSRADDFLGALPTFATETNTVAAEVVTNKNTAVTAAGTATTQAGIATTQAGEAAASAVAADASADAALASQNAAALSETNADASADAAAASAIAADASATSAAWRTSTTGSAKVPVGTTAERDSPAEKGYFRFNDTNAQFEGYNGSAWAGVGGASGGGGNPFVYENDAVVTANYTITANKNAMSAGPITINDGVQVTVPTGSVWTIV